MSESSPVGCTVWVVLQMKSEGGGSGVRAIVLGVYADEMTARRLASESEPPAKCGEMVIQ